MVYPELVTVAGFENFIDDAVCDGSPECVLEDLVYLSFKGVALQDRLSGSAQPPFKIVFPDRRSRIRNPVAVAVISRAFGCVSHRLDPGCRYANPG